MYSIDYPYVNMQEGQDWIDRQLPSSLVASDLLELKGGTAIKVLGLDK